MQLQEAFQINGVPTIIIDGRYITSIDEVRKALGLNGPEETNVVETLKVMEWLVIKAQKEKNTLEPTITGAPGGAVEKVVKKN